MGFLWFAGNCYWIYQTMLYFGGLPPLISAGILIAYSMVLGLYFAALGFLLTATARAFRSPHLRTPGRALFLGSAGTVVGTIDQGSMGFAGVLADR